MVEQVAEKVFINIYELAAMFDIRMQAAYNMCHAKGFPAKKIRGRWRIHKEKLERWIDTEFGGKVISVYGGRRA